MSRYLKQKLIELQGAITIVEMSTLLEMDGERMETETDFIFLGSKITADGDCSHEIKRCLAS